MRTWQTLVYTLQGTCHQGIASDLRENYSALISDPSRTILAFLSSQLAVTYVDSFLYIPSTEHPNAKVSNWLVSNLVLDA